MTSKVPEFKDIRLPSRWTNFAIGIALFSIPFFTYMSPRNLALITEFLVIEIILSLLILVLFTFIISFTIEKLAIKINDNNKQIHMFPLLCFVFYLQFLYSPYQEFIFEYFSDSGEYTFRTWQFLVFETLCLVVIIVGIKFELYFRRFFLFFSAFMLLYAIAPITLVIYQEFETKEKADTNNGLTQDRKLKEFNAPNIYYIILDAMVSLEAASKIDLIQKDVSLSLIQNTGLEYIEGSQSSYDRTYLTLASIFMADYHQISGAPKYSNTNRFFPGMLYNRNIDVPLLSYLKNENVKFLWSGNSYAACTTNKLWTCPRFLNNSLSRLKDSQARLFKKFYASTPIPKIYYSLFGSSYYFQDAIGAFLTYFKKEGVPAGPIFTFIHHLSPHGPFHVTESCERQIYGPRTFAGYKASYLCSLKKIKTLMAKINLHDPNAIVIFQGDHGSDGFRMGVEVQSKRENNALVAGIFNAIKAPEHCIKEFGYPKTSVNSIRFALNCAYGAKLPYKNEIHYRAYSADSPNFGSVYEGE